MGHYEYRNTPPPSPLPAGFVILNDSESKTKKHCGYTFAVKVASIDCVWGYAGDTSTVVVGGAYFHVEQSREEVLAMIVADQERRARAER